MSEKQNSTTADSKTSRKTTNHYLIDDFTPYAILLALVAIISAFTPYFWVPITTGLAAVILLATDIIKNRLIDIQLAIENHSQRVKGDR